jgi:transposase
MRVAVNVLESGTEPRVSVQAKFLCVECAFSANADFVAAVNIREAGLASLACSQPSSAARASCQEPTEGIPA